MPDKKTLKGKNFELAVKSILSNFQLEHPKHIRVIYQPRIILYDGQEVIPDFDLQIEFPFEESRHLIECQDRRRSSPSILQKIKYMKALSSRNRFIFVYAERIPDTTRKALEADGVIYLSFSEFVLYISRLDETLRAIERADFGDYRILDDRPLD